MKLLFICNQNKNRSTTAEEMMKKEFETKSAGLFNEKPVEERTLTWADAVIVMEDAQRRELAKRFPKQYLQKKILTLNIPDVYSYNQAALKEVINKKMKELVNQAML
ncbi:phosphotyrosine protein phosphatase [Candidatus Woesearchaeota archaeon]|nr:phosphotyrosine protein phosphatase [Candidatus Woesearchaeota archaeon]